jgi:hypothetical protein
MALHTPASRHCFYGAGQKRVIHFADVAMRKRFEDIRDKAINERDMESIGVIAAVCFDMVDGVKVTEKLVMKQMMADFGITEQQVKDARCSPAELLMMGLC